MLGEKILIMLNWLCVLGIIATSYIISCGDQVFNGSHEGSVCVSQSNRKKEESLKDGLSWSHKRQPEFLALRISCTYMTSFPFTTPLGNSLTWLQLSTISLRQAFVTDLSKLTYLWLPFWTKPFVGRVLVHGWDKSVPFTLAVGRTTHIGPAPIDSFETTKNLVLMLCVLSCPGGPFGEGWVINIRNMKNK